MWTFWVHETITGKPLFQIHPSAGNWRRAMGRGNGQHTVPLLDAETGLPRDVARRIAEPNAVSISVRWDDTVAYAGIILRADYSREMGALTLHHEEGVRTLFSQRLTFGVTTYAGGDLVVSGKNAPGVVRAILHRGAGGEWGSTWDLPLDLPADGSGPLSFHWRNWEWLTIEELLTQVEKLGYEIDFRPYVTASNHLRYEVRVAQKLTGPLVEFPVTVDETPLIGLTVTRDGAKQLSGCFYMGKGSEADMRWGEAGFVDGPGIPVRDAARSAKSIDDLDQLAEMAMADLLEHRYPTEQWGLDLVLDGSFRIQDLTIGAMLRLETRGDPFVPDGQHDKRLIALSGDMGFTVTPEVQ